jgi:hypothetical protein
MYCSFYGNAKINVGYCNTCLGIDGEEACEMKGDRRSFEGMNI